MKIYITRYHYRKRILYTISSSRKTYLTRPRNKVVLFQFIHMYTVSINLVKVIQVSVIYISVQKPEAKDILKLCHLNNFLPVSLSFLLS